MIFDLPQIRFDLYMTLKVLIKAINPPPPLLKGSSPESGKLVGSRFKGRGEITRQTAAFIHEPEMLSFGGPFWDRRDAMTFQIIFHLLTRSAPTSTAAQVKNIKSEKIKVTARRSSVGSCRA